ncbi:hypothetical protein AMTR_s00009p00127610 [Amborella trichopoda]|uniref:Uncharacterized protein n=1 Tax=Amborella trichopoda TaxID=13333 RepID=W1NI74_AMBTC|nr:hypothetical protein AMTR_s00009p00127610 [Amborella trichopoda]
MRPIHIKHMLPQSIVISPTKTCALREKELKYQLVRNCTTGITEWVPAPLQHPQRYLVFENQHVPAYKWKHVCSIVGTEYRPATGNRPCGTVPQVSEHRGSPGLDTSSDLGSGEGRVACFALWVRGGPGCGGRDRGGRARGCRLTC